MPFFMNRSLIMEELTLVDENVSSWKFLAEGGAHIVLENIDPASIVDKKILRIPKLIHDAIKPQAIHKVEDEIINICEDMKYNKKFIAQNMTSWFSPKYISHYELCVLSEAFAVSILQHVENDRPEGRKKLKPGKAMKLARVGYLERNLMSLAIPSLPNNGVRMVNIAMEIKVKCGLLSISPFLNETTELKRSLNKYQLMQYYKAAAVSTSHTTVVPWGTFEKISAYNPRDICSQNHSKITQAVKTLIENPQNNFRVVIDDEHLYGWDHLDRDAFQQRLQSTLFSQTWSESKTEECLMDMLSTILTEESVLCDLQKMQMLDFLDAEGVKLCYDRGVELCHGDQSKWNGMLKDYFSESTTDYKSLLNLVAPLYDNSGSVLSLCQLQSVFSSSSETADVIAFIKQLDVNQTLYSIKAWILSLIARDASVVVCIGIPQPLQCLPLDKMQVDVEQRMLHIGHGMSCPYEIKLLDIGLKSIHKVIEKADKELEICTIVKKFLSQHQM